MANKMKKLYPLHIVTTFVMLILLFLDNKIDSIIGCVFNVIMNIFLIQEWVPIITNSINGVSWFLCTLVVGYFVFHTLSNMWKVIILKRKLFYQYFFQLP